MKNVRQVVIDMDGTFVDLYGVENWEEQLHNSDVTPYEIAEPLVDMDKMRELLEEIHDLGGTVTIVSWSAMNGSKEYNKEVKKAKIEWCKNYNLPIDSFHVVKYGTKKWYPLKDRKDAVLFDDNENVRKQFEDEEFNRIAYDAFDMFNVIETIINQMRGKDATLAAEMIERACEKRTMAYCYQAQDGCKTVTKVGMTTRGMVRVWDYCTEHHYRNRKDIVYFPVDNAADAHAMEDMLHAYFHLQRKTNNAIFKKADRFYNAIADVSEMLKEDGMLMQYYHALGY